MESEIEAIIVSWFNDPHSQLVQRQLNTCGIEWRWIRLGLDADAYRLDGDLSTLSIQVEGELFTVGEQLNSRVIYLPFRVDRPPSVSGARSKFSSREWDASIKSLLIYAERRSRYPWFIATGAIELQDRKPYLLATAINVCRTLRVPHTRITNHLSTLPDKSVEHVLKAVNMWQEISDGKYFNTTSVDNDLLSTMIGCDLSAPVLLQEKIPHQKELRIYYSFGSMCAVELNAPGESIDDFRLLSKQPGGEARIMGSRELNSAKIGADIQAIAVALDISYFSVDIGVTSNSYWLFDINPIGSWEYLWDEFSVDVSPVVISSYMEAKT